MYKITVPDLELEYYQENLTYVKYQKKNDLMLLCGKEEAQGILSKDNSRIYKFHKDDVLKEDYPVCQVQETGLDECLGDMESKMQASDQEMSQTIDSILTEVLPSLMGV